MSTQHFALPSPRLGARLAYRGGLLFIPKKCKVYRSQQLCLCGVHFSVWGRKEQNGERTSGSVFNAPMKERKENKFSKAAFRK